MSFWPLDEHPEEQLMLSPHDFNELKDRIDRAASQSAQIQIQLEVAKAAGFSQYPLGGIRLIVNPNMSDRFFPGSVAS